MSLNKVMIIGNVGMDPEVRYLESGSKTARLRIAITERYKSKDGEVRETTEWVTVRAWRKTAEFVESYIKKGRQVYVEGKLHTDEYTGNDGIKKYSTEVIADRIEPVGPRPAEEGAQQAHTATPQAPAYQPRPAAPQAHTQPLVSEDTFEPQDDDLPF